MGVLACAPPAVPDAGEPDPFPGSATSLEELGQRALAGLTARDSATLNAIRLTEAEHNLEVWPELPASRPEVNFPLDYAWRNIQLRNGRAVARLLPRLSGAEVSLEGVACRGESQFFEAFVVHTDCWVTFTTAAGSVVEAQLFKDALERGGRLKIFRYYEEPYVERQAAAPVDGPPTGG